MQFSKFMEEKLAIYIQENLDRGVPIYQIKKTLLNHGHHQDIVESVIGNLDHPHKNLSDPDRHLVDDIRKYVHDQTSAGHKKHDIIKHLRKYHHEDIIRRAMEDARVGDKAKYRRFVTKVDQYLLPGSLLLMLIIIFNFVALTNASFINVFVSFIPTLVSILAVYFLSSSLHRHMLWLVSPIVIAVFYVLSISSASILSDIEVMNVLGLNLLFSWSFTFIIYRLIYYEKVNNKV